MDASIVFVTDDGKQREIPLRQRSYVIGRAQDAGFRVPDGSMSRHHAEIAFDGSGVTIKDLKSSNGTFVNGSKLVPSETKAVSAGDALLVGSTLLVIRLDGSPDASSIDIEALRRFADPTQADPVSASAGGTPGAAKSPPEADADASSMVAGLLDDLDISSDDDGSSLGDFEFDFSDDEDDEDEQPKL